MNKFLRPFIIAASFAVVAFMIYDALDPRYRFPMGTTLISETDVDSVFATTSTPDTVRITIPPDSDTSPVTSENFERLATEPPPQMHHPTPTMNDFKVFNYKALLVSLAVFAGLFTLTFNQKASTEA